MSQHDHRVRLRHMLDHALTARRLSAGRIRRDLDEDEMLRLALTRAVEVVGEAAAQVTPADRARYPSIPWPKIVGMRQRLVHGYNTIDLQILWDTIADELPPLIEELQRIVGEGRGDVQ